MSASDAFDFAIQLSPFLAKLGGLGYDTLIKMNTIINKFRNQLGFERVSFAHLVKSKIKKAINYIKDFEEQAIRYGLSKNADYVICGHIHMPKIKIEKQESKCITYLNAGDWIENLTALEFKENCWSIYQYDELDDLTKQFQALKANYENSAEKTGTKAWHHATGIPKPSTN